MMRELQTQFQKRGSRSLFPRKEASSVLGGFGYFFGTECLAAAMLSIISPYLGRGSPLLARRALARYKNLLVWDSSLKGS